MTVNEALKWSDDLTEEFLPVMDEDCIKTLAAEVRRLRGHIIDCLDNNGHLADGENCTLIDLKRAVPEWELWGE